MKSQVTLNNNAFPDTALVCFIDTRIVFVISEIKKVHRLLFNFSSC